MEAETCKRELVIEVPVDAVEREAETVATQYARQVRIPGFRPGRAPKDLVRRRFKDEIKSDVVKALVPKYFETAVKDQKWSVVGNPEFEDLKFESDQPLTIKATFEIYPEVELKEYKGLEVEEDAAVVTDTDVEKTLDDLRESAAVFEVVSDRPAADEDYLSVSYTGRFLNDPEAKPIEVSEGQVHLGGKTTFAAFTENLRGASPGDVREFEADYPADYPHQSLAGKTVRYHVQVQSIKRKVLPAVDDELAKSVSEFSTLEELKARLRENLEKRKQRQVENEAKQKLIEKLIEAHTFPVPEKLVKGQLQRKIERAVTQLVRQGIDPRQTELDWSKLREEFLPEADKDVRAMLILEKVADAEKIEVSEEEVDEIIREMAEDQHEPPAALKTRLTQNNGLGRLKSSHRTQKALDFIYRNAKITRKSD